MLQKILNYFDSKKELLEKEKKINELLEEIKRLQSSVRAQNVALVHVCRRIEEISKLAVQLMPGMKVCTVCKGCGLAIEKEGNLNIINSCLMCNGKGFISESQTTNLQ